MCKKEFVEKWETDYSFQLESMFVYVKDFLKESDYTIGNLETPLAGKEYRYTSKSFNFNSPVEFGEAVKWAGIDLVSTANNHCLDRGIDGLVQTNINLDRIGLLHVGTRNHKSDPSSIIVNLGKIKMGVMAYTCGTEAPWNRVWLEREEMFHVNLSQNQELFFKP